MAANTTYDTNASIREDLANDIRLISPTETPFYSGAKKVAVGNRRNDFLQNALTAANKDNAVIEGANASAAVHTNPERRANSCQLMDKSVDVSSTTRASETAGREDDYDYQLLLRGLELRRDLESALTQDNAEVIGDNSTARKMGSLESTYATNVSRGATGSNGGWNGTIWTSPTDGTQRALSEALLKEVLRSCFDNGGDPGMIMVGPFNKQKASETFTGIAALRRDTGASLSQASVMGAVDIYRSDFGVLNIYPNRFQRDRTLHVLDMNHWEVGVMQDFTEEPLAKTGHSDKGMVFCEKTLRPRQEAASGVVADLETS